MAKKSKKAPPNGPPEFTPVVIETFHEPGVWEQSKLRAEAPSSFNGIVRVLKYRITIERIEEPLEVIQARLLKLWREEDNHHHYHPLNAVGKRYGLDLPELAYFGCDRRKKP